MQFALYRYEFEVMEKKVFSANLFPNLWNNLSPREAFERKSELLDELLEKDYQMPDPEGCFSDSEHNIAKSILSEGFFEDFAAEELSHQKGVPPKPIQEKRVPTPARSTVKPWLQFTNGHKTPLHHKQMIAPQKGFAILELARCSSKVRHPRPFLSDAVKEPDYKSLHIIIDNRGTHQRVAIEVKPSVFKETDAVADSLARALSMAFARYGLLVKVVPIRDDKHFWNVVGDKKQFPAGFKKLHVKFPQINDPKVTEDMRRANLIYREMFHSNLCITQEPPQGESLHFDENDERQREYIRLCTENADSITLSPIGGRSFALGGKTAKTLQMTESERKSIEEGIHQQGIFDDDPTQSTKSFMDKAYGQS